MKFLSFSLLVLVSSFIIAQPGNGTELYEQGLKPWKETYGKVSYKIVEGGNGTAELRFDQNGWLTATSFRFDYNMYGMDVSMNELTIRDGDFLYIYDLTKKTGREKKSKTESDLLRYKPADEAREAMYTVNGGQMIGEETILNRESKHWTFSSGPILELWEWNGIILKAKLKRPRVTFTYEAIDINLDQPVIEYPESITIK